MKQITVIIHTESELLLDSLIDNLKISNIRENITNILINAKGCTPWTNNTLFQKIISLPKNYYEITPTEKLPTNSIVELLTKVKTEQVLILSENISTNTFKDWDKTTNTHLLASTNDLLHLNWDNKYNNINGFISDLITQKTKYIFNIKDDRYNKKIKHPLFYERIIHIDGGLGDHVMAYPLLEKIGKDCYVSCVYPFALSHIKTKGQIEWTNELFGGYNRFVYNYGSTNNTSTIIDAYFEMYGEKREEQDILKYNGPITPYKKHKPIALISTTAAKIGGLDSNKDWPEIRWFKLIYELKQLGYHVIQVGSHKDNQLPKTFLDGHPYVLECKGGVDEKFLDKSIPELAGLIEASDLWISVDTFFHHFASSIKSEVGICLTPFYNDHAKHKGVTYIEKDSGKNYYDRRWWLDSQQPERKDCMNLITVDDVLKKINKPNSKRKYKVIYYSLGPNDNCSNWRAYMPFERISEFIEYNVIDLTKEKFDLERDKHVDAVILNRPVINLLEYIKTLQLYGVKVIVDYDDVFPYVDLNESVFIPAYTEMLNILHQADMVITTNNVLKFYFEKHTKKPLFIFPNVVNPERVSIKENRTYNKIILGWYGSKYHLPSLKMINKDVLKILDEFNNVYFNLYTDNQEIIDLFKHPKTIVYPYEPNFNKFQDNLNDIDINLAPLDETYINLGKSDIRVQLAAFKEIVNIASNFGEYKNFGKLNKGIVLVEDNWYDAIKELVSNTNKLHKIKVNALKTINEYYNYEKWSNIKDQIIINLINGTK
jgi:ADP-heptose:LPS heptosyltransferase